MNSWRIASSQSADRKHDECCPTHALRLTLGKMDSLPRCYFSPVFFKQHARLSVMLTITASTHRMGTFSVDRFNSFNIRVNWLLASESLIKAREHFLASCTLMESRSLVAPLGPFNILFRQWAIQQWLEWEDPARKSTLLTCNLLWAGYQLR